MNRTIFKNIKLIILNPATHIAPITFLFDLYSYEEYEIFFIKTRKLKIQTNAFKNIFY